MSYFPILKAPYCNGETTLYNFSPNNWESVCKRSKTINLSYTDGTFWHSEVLGEIAYGDYQVIKYQDIKYLSNKGRCILKYNFLYFLYGIIN